MADLIRIGRTYAANFALSVALLPSPVQSGAAVFDSLLNHKFLTILEDNGTQRMVHYEVCAGDSPLEALKWPVAGFGVDFLSAGLPGVCARKTFTTYGNVVPYDEGQVYFQNGDVGAVKSLFRCLQFFDLVDLCGGEDVGLSYSFVSRQSLLIGNPDAANVEVETLELSVERFPDSSFASISIRTSEGYEQIVVAFPQGRVNEQLFERVFGQGDNIEISTFSYFAELSDLNEDFLFGEAPGDSLVISARRVDEQGITLEIKEGDIGMLGQIIRLYGVIEGRVVSLDEGRLGAESF